MNIVGEGSESMQYWAWVAAIVETRIDTVSAGELYLRVANGSVAI